MSEHALIHEKNRRIEELDFENKRLKEEVEAVTKSRDMWLYQSHENLERGDLWKSRCEKLVEALRNVARDECNNQMFNATCHCHGPAKILRKLLASLQAESEGDK